MNANYTFDFRLSFLFEKRNKSYLAYDTVSIAKEKGNIIQKNFLQNWLCRFLERIGV